MAEPTEHDVATTDIAHDLPDEDEIRSLLVDQNGHQFTGQTRLESTWSKYGGWRALTGPFTCTVCGAWIKLRESGGVLRATGAPCPSPDWSSITIELPVPSGRMLVMGNRRAPLELPPGLPGISTSPGIDRIIRALAADGYAYGITTEFGSALFRTGEDTLQIAYAYDTDVDEHALPGGELLAEIDTDGLEYVVVDAETWRRRGGSIGPNDTAVDVTTGTYEFAYHGAAHDFNSYGPTPVVFTHIRRVA